MAVFRDEPRYRRSGKRIPLAYIVAGGDVNGIPAGPVATVFLNDHLSRDINPARECLARQMVADLNATVSCFDEVTPAVGKPAQSRFTADEVEIIVGAVRRRKGDTIYQAERRMLEVLAVRLETSL